MILNTEADKETFETYYYNLDWNLRELTEFLTKKVELEGPCRLRNLNTNKLFVREELDTPLRTYFDF